MHLLLTREDENLGNKICNKIVLEWLSKIHYHKSKETVAYLGLHPIIYIWNTFFIYSDTPYCIARLLCVCWSFRILNLACMKYFKIFWSNKNLVFAIINLLHGWWFFTSMGHLILLFISNLCKKCIIKIPFMTLHCFLYNLQLSSLTSLNRFKNAESGNTPLKN